MGFASPVTRWFKEGTYFKDHLYDTLSSNSKWSDMINQKEAMKLLEKNKTSGVDYSYQLWALQNVLAF